ncbi:VOC family protein [Caulobacter endophyticus]|uniref:Glyoxalase n=1 Tax=Caulobacter endophyticus TaxID=2172652 RepID=A0A2T9KCJ5_9CAUL|nr:VOC family protein [Caulobacter endophyticus]PVM93690.1 glyoxalase [Caulobacter endophyticus]
MKAFLKSVFAIAFALACQGTAMAEPIGRVTGIGGLFVKSKDPKALANWYRDVLGLEVAAWGGAALAYDAPGHPPKISWMAFPQTSDHMAPSAREFMVNFAVDDMDAITARLRASNVAILKCDDDNAFGRFAWVQDPDGTLVELWQPK